MNKQEMKINIMINAKIILVKVFTDAGWKNRELPKLKGNQHYFEKFK